VEKAAFRDLTNQGRDLMNQEGMFKPALIGGVLLGILSAVPVIGAFNCVCCAWVIGGGMLAAHLYVRGASAAVTLGTGVLLGLLTGAIGAVVDTLFTLPIQLALRSTAGFGNEIRQVLDRVPNLPPETRDMLRNMFFNGRGLGLFFIILTGFFKLAVYSVVGMLGGAIGVAVFERRKPGGSSTSQPPTYQPPIDIPNPPDHTGES
jgi:hypothetical protein